MLFQSPRFVSSALIALLVLNSAAANEEEEPEWHQQHDGEWCIRMPQRQACLPAGFKLVRFDQDHAMWLQRYEPGHMIRIKYEVKAAEYDDSILASQCLVLQKSFGTRYVDVTELTTDPAKDVSERIDILVAVFHEGFSISLAGTDLERMREIALSLSNEWSWVPD